MRLADHIAQSRLPFYVRSARSHQVGQLNGVLVARDAKRWREITHTIKGAAQGVGAFGMGEAAAAAEPVDPANTERARAAIKSLETEAQSVRGFIQTYLAA